MKPWFPPSPATLPASSEVRRDLNMDPDADSVRTCLLAATLAASFVALILPSAIGMKTNGVSFEPAFVFVPSVAILWLWASWRRRSRVRAIAELAVLPILLSLPVLVFSYAAMRTALPLQDARLEAWDSTIGFRALDFIGWVNAHPTFGYILSRCYSSFFPQLLLLPVLLAASGYTRRAYEMTLAILLIGIFGSALCMFFPAHGIYVHHGIPDGAFVNIKQSPGYFYLQLDAVRHDPNFVLDFGQAKGIVAFPSGHAAMAVTCAWAAWAWRWARWPLLTVNIGMIVSAIPQGAHYLVDLLAGGAVAAFAILLATHLPTAVAARRS